VSSAVSFSVGNQAAAFVSIPYSTWPTKRKYYIHLFIYHEWSKIQTSNSAELIKKYIHEHTIHTQSGVTNLSNRTEQT